MATIDGPRYTGTLLIDLTALQDEIVDLPPGALQGARAEKEGLKWVLEELATAMPNHGEEAEIHPAVYQRVLHATAAITTLRDDEITLVKLLEVCRETRGKLENNREDDLSTIGSKAEDMADKGKKPGLRAHFEKTIKYKSLIADKAAETRRKNEDAKDEAAKNTPPAGEAKNTPPAGEAKNTPPAGEGAG